MILIFQQFTFPQQNNLSNEKGSPSVDESVFINLNSTTFVNGETLHYKLYCLKNSNKNPSNTSKVAYVELIDSDKKVVFRNKLFLKNGSGDGDYFIPSTLKATTVLAIYFSLNSYIVLFDVIVNIFVLSSITNLLLKF